ALYAGFERLGADASLSDDSSFESWEAMGRTSSFHRDGGRLAGRDPLAARVNCINGGSVGAGVWWRSTCGVRGGGQHLYRGGVAGDEGGNYRFRLPYRGRASACSRRRPMPVTFGFRGQAALRCSRSGRAVTPREPDIPRRRVDRETRGGLDVRLCSHQGAGGGIHRGSISAAVEIRLASDGLDGSGRDRVF